MCFPRRSTSLVGDAQLVNAAPSRLQVKVDPGSVEVKSNLTVTLRLVS